MPPPSGTRSNDQQQNQDWAICGTGFGRKVPRAKLQEFAEEVMQDFPPDVIEDGTFWAYSFSKYFLVKFTSKANFLTALDYLKNRNAPYMFEDEIDGEEKKIWVRRNKPLVEIKMGQSNSHFYTGVSTMFKDTDHAEKKLKHFNGEWRSRATSCSCSPWKRPLEMPSTMSTPPTRTSRSWASLQQ